MSENKHASTVVTFCRNALHKRISTVVTFCRNALHKRISTVVTFCRNALHKRISTVVTFWGDFSTNVIAGEAQKRITPSFYLSLSECLRPQSRLSRFALGDAPHANGCPESLGAVIPPVVALFVLPECGKAAFDIRPIHQDAIAHSHVMERVSALSAGACGSGDSVGERDTLFDEHWSIRSTNYEGYLGDSCDNSRGLHQ